MNVAEESCWALAFAGRSGLICYRRIIVIDYHKTQLIGRAGP